MNESLSLEPEAKIPSGFDFHTVYFRPIVWVGQVGVKMIWKLDE